VARLIPISPNRGMTPVSHGAAHLAEAPMTAIWSIAPYRGQKAALSAALQSAHGLGFPEPGMAPAQGAVTLAWSGHEQAMLIGAVPDPALAAFAAITDQSDAWAHLLLSGPAARDVLARLVPIDLSPAAFAVGHAARSQLGHMNLLLIQPQDGVFALMVYRSMAATALHEVTQVMRMVAARGA
jgi:heterotetrameric sarcosine oxidase gamma subunit